MCAFCVRNLRHFLLEWYFQLERKGCQYLGCQMEHAETYVCKPFFSHFLISHSPLKYFALYSGNTPEGFGTMVLNKLSDQCSQIRWSGMSQLCLGPCFMSSLQVFKGPTYSFSVGKSAVILCLVMDTTDRIWG